MCKSTTRKYQDQHAFSNPPRQRDSTPHEHNGSTKEGRGEERNVQYAPVSPKIGLPEAFAPPKPATQVRERVEIEERKSDGDLM